VEHRCVALLYRKPVLNFYQSVTGEYFTAIKMLRFFFAAQKYIEIKQPPKMNCICLKLGEKSGA
jgi:hypothetical protein